MRGKIQYRERAQQIRDFAGLRYGNITPTDIDAFLEFQDTLYILVEAKCVGCALVGGQRLALERLCNVVHGTINERGETRTAVVIWVEHNTPVDQDVDYAKTGVVSVFYYGKWVKPTKRTTLKQMIDHLLKWHTQLRYRSP